MHRLLSHVHTCRLLSLGKDELQLGGHDLEAEPATAGSEQRALALLRGALAALQARTDDAEGEGPGEQGPPVPHRRDMIERYVERCRAIVQAAADGVAALEKLIPQH